jgi:hypothetical protein
MLRSLLLLTIVSFSSVHTCAQQFNELTSTIFFNFKLGNDVSVDTFLAKCDSMPELTRVESSGWTMYPYFDKASNPIPFAMYTFRKHPYFSGIEDGHLLVLTKKESNKLAGVTLSVLFPSTPGFDSTYNQILKLYTSYADETTRRPNVARAFEATKFLTKDENFIIITKGETDGKPYLHFAYNFQGYEW